MYVNFFPFNSKNGVANQIGFLHQLLSAGGAYFERCMFCTFGLVRINDRLVYHQVGKGRVN